MLLVKIFCETDDFCKLFQKQFQKVFLTDGKKLRNRSFIMKPSEIMTIAIYFHFSGYKTFKDYYEKYVLVYFSIKSFFFCYKILKMAKIYIT